tara:strand:- start:899 stop:1453 length:555 start_codon:yes stop_codon:yes gene_type:complete
MGETNGALAEIDKISESKPRVLKSEGILITTFKSAARAGEIESYLTSLNRNFFIFEVGGHNTGYNIMNKMISKDLFSHIEDEIKSGEIIPMTHYQEEIILPDIEFKPEMLSYKDRLDYINHLISDEGYEFLTLEDKKFYILAFKETPGFLEGQEKVVVEQIIEKGYENLSNEDKELLKLLSNNK